DDVVKVDTVTAGLVKIKTGSGMNSISVLNSVIGSLGITGGDKTDLLSIDSCLLGAITIDAGGGNDAISLTNTAVNGLFNVKAGDGYDVIFAANLVATTGGTMDGGGKTDIFQDGGGNFGFATTNIEGFI